jgi:hypothetical protein
MERDVQLKRVTTHDVSPGALGKIMDKIDSLLFIISVPYGHFVGRKDKHSQPCPVGTFRAINRKVNNELFRWDILCPSVLGED